MKKKLLLEACVETWEQAVLSEKNGADRIELCADLSAGGLSPDESLVRRVTTHLSIPVMVMVRPRSGNFVYHPEELAQMEWSIQRYKQLKVHGIVLGLLTTENKIDLEQTERLARIAKSSVDGTKSLSVTFHKAIDHLEIPLEGALQLLQLSGLVDRILTSGGSETALEGATILREMIARVGKSDYLQILPAGKITYKNLHQVHAAIGANEYHGRRIVF